MQVPHDLDAEDGLLGDMLALPHIIGDVSALVVPGDFYQPYAGAAFAALTHAYHQGEPLDVNSLLVALREAGAEPDPRWVTRLASCGSSAWRVEARTVVAHRVRRQLAHAIIDVQVDVRNPSVDPGVVIDRLRGHLDSIAIPDGRPPADLHDLDEFIDRPENASAPWIVPGLLRRGWRVVVVAGEGVGKSTLWRQFAVLAAQGMHPLGFTPLEPCRTLLVDLENPPDAIASGCRPIREQVGRRQPYQPGRAWLWHRPQGIDLRTRAHRAELGAVLAATKPDLVCLGPLYKAYRRDARETDEQAASEVQAVLDDFRTRHGFALLMEHHAPQDNQGYRKMRPFGSSLWLRWPEIGIAMESHNDDPPGSLRMNRWRNDRMVSAWPQRLDRGDVWPWVGVWNDPNWSVPA